MQSSDRNGRAWSKGRSIKIVGLTLLIAALVTMAAYIDGGLQPLHPITQDIAVPGAGE